MAKLSDCKIKIDDIREYLETSSDFAFEIRVMKQLLSLGFECQHGGTYRDPVSGVTREFDIRTSFRKRSCRILTAFECKNLGENHPLVLHCRPRKSGESYQEYLIGVNDSNRYPYLPGPPVIIKKFSGVDCVYEPGQLVAKSTDQIGRHEQSDEIVTGDGAVFPKISQAINSCYDLIEKASDASPGDIYSTSPVLVVPNNSIWMVHYDDDGNIVGDPSITAQASLFIGKSWYIDQGLPLVSFTYSISHLDIVSIDALESFAGQLLLGDKSILRFSS